MFVDLEWNPAEDSQCAIMGTAQLHIEPRPQDFPQQLKTIIENLLLLAYTYTYRQSEHDERPALGRLTRSGKTLNQNIRAQRKTEFSVTSGGYTPDLGV